jgi:uncharacterized protein (TIGR02266 family)
MGPDNKRISRRAPVVLRIKLRYTSVDSFVQKFATNLSPGGMFISSRAPKPIGTTVKFELRLADESTVINGSGIVRWTQEYDPEHPRRLFGMGIEFAELSDESREIIERIVEHKRSLGLPDDDEIPMSNRRDPQAAAPAAEPVPAAPVPPVAEAPPPVAAAPRPARTRRQAVPIAELIARASPPAPVPDDDDLLSAVDGEMPNLSTALARARQLAGSVSEGGELDALLKVSASPVARSVADASSALAAVLGGASVSTRRARASNGRAEREPASEPGDPDPDPAPPIERQPDAEQPSTALQPPEPEPDPGPSAAAADREAEPASTSDDPTAGLAKDSGPISSGPDQRVTAAAGRRIEAWRPDLDPAPLPGMPPDTSSSEPPPSSFGAPILDAASISDTSSSGSIDLSELADQLLGEGGADALSHDLDADALDAEALLASGVDRLLTPRQRRKSAPVSLPEPPDLSSFADPPTMTGTDSLPAARRRDSDGAGLDDLDAALAALDAEPEAQAGAPGSPSPHRAARRSDYDSDEQPLLTRADGPPLGMMPPPLPPRAFEPDAPLETELDDFDVDIDLELEPDYESYDSGTSEELEANGADDDEAKKKGLLSRMFGRKK